MKKIGNIFLVFFLVFLTSFVEDDYKENTYFVESTMPLNQYTEQFYNCLNEESLSFKAFEIGVKGYYNLFIEGELANSKYLSIVDLTISSNEKRLFIIDMKTQKVVHKSLIAHGKNTGEEYANSFSNEERSHKTSLGFYKTAETYDGRKGFSLKIDGLEYSNSNARNRGVVIHSADYVNEAYIEGNGRLGRSFGCPSLPEEGYEAVVNLLKEGSCFFIYYPQKDYLIKSKLVNSENNYLFTSTGELAFAG